MVFNFSRKEKISPKTSIHAQALKGQGTTEYLVIVGVIIVISLVVVSLTINFTSGADTTGNTNIKTQLESDLIGVTDIISDNTGNVAVTIKNNDAQPYRITKIEIDGSEAGFVKLLGTGENQTFVVSAPEECANGKRTVTLKITYKPIDSEIEKIRYIENIPINCEEYTIINPLKLDRFAYQFGEFSCPESVVCVSDNSFNHAINLPSAYQSITTTTDGDYTVHIFDYDGFDKKFIPDFNGTISVKIWGAGGGGGNIGGWSVGFAGGGGGYTSGMLSVTSGEPITIIVGEGGLQGRAASISPSYGGGGRSCSSGSDCRYGGQGGGMSAIKLNNTYLAIAGGGGAGGSSRSASYSMAGGAGGGSSGANGSSGYSSAPNAKGKGGTQSAGGAGGTGSGANGNPGTQYQGGSSIRHAGAGGGGYYGGGGGAYQESYTMAGGGGGSGYASSGFTTTAGSGTTPANSSDTDRGSAGNGGAANSNGNNGRVVIRYLTSLGSATTYTANPSPILFTGELDWNKSADYSSTSTSDYLRDLSGLIGYYKFNELNSSGRIIDYAGYDNNLISYNSASTSNGATIAHRGLWGTKSAYIDASTTYFRTAATSEFNFERTNSFSACAWIYPVSTSANMTILSKMTTALRGWDLYVESGTRLKSSILYSSTNGLSKYIPTIIEPFKWQHVCMTYDGSSNITGLKIYYNGNQKTTTTTLSNLNTNLAQTTNAFAVGTRATGTSSFYGNIDEVKIWNRTLTDEEIANDYNAWTVNGEYISQIIDLNENAIIKNIILNSEGPVIGGEINPNLDEDLNNGLISLWHFNETDSSTYSDSSGNENTLSPSSEEDMVLIDGDYTIYEYNTTGTFTPNFSGNIIVQAWGAGGAGGAYGSYGSTGGGGAYASSTISVTSGETLIISPGEGGGAPTNSCVTNTGGGIGGNSPYGRGGNGGDAAPNGCSSGGGGGGAGSFVFRDSNLLLAAGGGGGGAGAESCYGAGAGGAGGVNGSSGSYGNGGLAGGNTTSNGSSGLKSSSDASGSGGGGGGYLGGIAGDTPYADCAGGGGGGGGSSYADTITNGSGTTPGNSSDPLRGNAGKGGALSTAGSAGKIIIKFLTSQGNATSDTSILPPTPTTGLWITSNLEFGQGNTYLSLEDNSLFNNNSNFTISGWIYFEEYLGAITLLSKDGESGFYVKIGSGSLNNGQLYARYGTAVGGLGFAGAVTPNKWHHIAVTYAPGTMYGYLDGELIGAQSGNAPSGMDDKLFIGAFALNDDRYPSSGYFKGKIEELAIWNRTLTLNEIKRIYSTGSTNIGIKYRTCDDSNCIGEEWTALNYTQGQEINIGQTNRYFQWGLQPYYYQFYETEDAGCYSQTPSSKTCSNFTSQEYCEAENGWDGDCYWEETADYCKNAPNYSYPECYYYSGNQYECELREPACAMGQGYCEGDYGYNYQPDCYYFSGDSYECDLRAPACQSNTGCVGYLGNGCYNQYDESSCNSLGFCYWDGWNCYSNDPWGACYYGYSDETSCNSAGFCYWDGYSCYAYDCYYAYDETSCNNIPGGGCYWGHECYNGYNYNTGDSYKCYDYDWPGYEDESLCNNTPGCYWNNPCYNNYDEENQRDYTCEDMYTQEENFCNNTSGCVWGNDSYCGAQIGNVLPCSMAQSSTTCSYLTGCAFRTEATQQYTIRPNANPLVKDLNLSYYN